MRVFTIRIIYKSGYAIDFDCTEFTITGHQYKWTTYGEGVRPVLLNIDEVAAVWQISHREVKE